MEGTQRRWYTIKILKADKEKATFAMNTKEYDRKVHELLDDRTAYSVSENDPTRSTKKNLLTKLKDLRKRGKISECVYNRVKSSEGSSKLALFYGLVKLHKE